MSVVYSSHLFNYYRLGGEVSKVFPDLLLTTMEILYSQYKALKGKDIYTFNTDAGKEKVRRCNRSKYTCIPKLIEFTPRFCL